MVLFLRWDGSGWVQIEWRDGFWEVRCLLACRRGNIYPFRIHVGGFVIFVV